MSPGRDRAVAARDLLADRVGRLSEAYRPSPTALGALRIVYALSVLLRPTDVLWVRDVPDGLVNPGPGLPALVAPLHDSPLPMVLQGGQVLVAVWLLLGWRTTAASVSMVAVRVTASALVYSFSKVDHLILYELLPLVLAAAGWGATLSFDARRRTRPTDGLPLVAFSGVIAFAMASAAAAKAATGWLSPGSFGALSYVVEDHLAGERPGPLAAFAIDNGSLLIWKLADWGTVFVEGWLVIALLWPSLFRLGLVLLVAFHAGVYLTLDIRFDLYLVVYAAYFLVPAERWFPPLTRAIRSRRRLPSASLAGTGA